MFGKDLLTPEAMQSIDIFVIGLQNLKPRSLPLQSLEEPGYFFLNNSNCIRLKGKKVIDTLHGLRVSKSWDNFHFWVSYPFNRLLGWISDWLCRLKLLF